jgi:hypothetical protein
MNKSKHLEAVGGVRKESRRKILGSKKKTFTFS